MIAIPWALLVFILSWLTFDLLRRVERGEYRSAPKVFEFAPDDEEPSIWGVCVAIALMLALAAVMLSCIAVLSLVLGAVWAGLAISVDALPRELAMRVGYGLMYATFVPAALSIITLTENYVRGVYGIRHAWRNRSAVVEA